MTPSTSSDSFVLVTNIIASAPTSMMLLRAACDRALPAAAFICVVSAVRRLMTSPDRVLS